MAGAGTGAIRGDRLDRRHELISALRKRADEARGLGRIAQRAADLRDAEIEAAIEIDECPGSPDGLPQLFAADDGAGARDEGAEDSGRLRLQAHHRAVSAQLARRGVELEDAESHARCRGPCSHV